MTAVNASYSCGCHYRALINIDACTILQPLEPVSLCRHHNNRPLTPTLHV